MKHNRTVFTLPVLHALPLTEEQKKKLSFLHNPNKNKLNDRCFVPKCVFLCQIPVSVDSYFALRIYKEHFVGDSVNLTTPVTFCLKRFVR